MASRPRMLVLLLFQLSLIFLLLVSVQCSNKANVTGALQARDDDDSEDKRLSVKKWFNSLISANSPNNKKSSPTNVSISSNANRSSSVPYRPASAVNRQFQFPIVPVPVSTTHMFHNPIMYSAVPLMTYPYSHRSNMLSSETTLLPISASDMLSSSSMYQKDHFPFYTNNYFHPSMFYARTTPLAYDSRGLAYAIPIPVPIIPYMQR